MNCPTPRPAVELRQHDLIPFLQSPSNLAIFACAHPNRRKPMPDLNKPIREEITRLTRKELKDAFQSQHKINIALKKSLAAVKAECAELRREVKAIHKCLPKPPPVATTPEVADDKLKRFRPTTNTIKQLRAKLGVSQANFAKLVNVSLSCVRAWERKESPLQLRDKTKASLFALRTVDKREAKARLSESTEEK
jgi:DNA-binding transcriptional regulator YiaG